MNTGPTKKAVLLVDDSHDDLYLTSLGLQKTNLEFDILTFPDAFAASKHLFGDDPSISRIKLILLDLHMPGMDGIHLLKLLRNHQQTELLPVVMFSTAFNEADVFTAFRYGANSYIEKPSNYKEYIDVVNRAATYWLGMADQAYKVA